MLVDDLYQIISEGITELIQEKQTPVLVAVNGIEGSGKTVFSQNLVRFLKSSKIEALHISIDGFHNDKNVRYRQGRDSAIGYYEDSYDEQAFVSRVLKSSQNGVPKVTTAIYDIYKEEALNNEPEKISNNAVIVSDGSYLFKTIYSNYWDLKIYLEVDKALALERGSKRDEKLLNSYILAREKFINRYHKASSIYNKKIRPKKQADIIIDNNDFNAPYFLKI